MIPQPTQQAAANSVHTADLICRLDFASFVWRCFHTLSPSAEYLPNWHIDALAYDIEQVRLGGVTRLIVNLPPRSLKSVITSVAFPAFVLGHDPSKRVIVVSHSADLAIKLANEFRVILNTPWYRRVFPGTFISRSKNTELEVVTTRNGSRLAVSIGGALTGRGADIIIVDDALKAMDALSDSKREKRVNELFNNTVLTRLDNKRTGAIVVVGQRLHENDLPGMLQRSGVPWKTLSFPAIAVRDERIQTGKHSYHLRHAGDALHPEREPLETLEAIRAQIGPYFFAAQYQQAPTSSDHAMIQRAWIRRYDALPQRTYESRVIQSWDTAAKAGEMNDYSACATLLFQGGKVYLVHMLREQLGYPALRERAIAHARKFGVNEVLVEDVGIGTGLIGDLRDGGRTVRAVTPKGSKITRMAVQSHKLANGTLLLPKSASWLAEFEDELFGFPYARHDDQIDAISQALEHCPLVHSRRNIEANQDPHTALLNAGKVYGGWVS